MNEIVIGRTKNKTIITVCINCECYHIPHFNCIGKNYCEAISLLEPRLIDSPANIELKERTDIESFLNNIVDIKKIQKNNKTVKKLNTRFTLRRKKRNTNKKYANVEVAEVEEDMTYWELIIKLWNKYNKQKTPENLCKPYYRNLLEMIDSACFGGDLEYLNGGRCYTRQDQEREPHFVYELATGEQFNILFERAEYLQPVHRKLTKQELEILVRYLNAPQLEDERLSLDFKNYWQFGVWLWNDQNYDYVRSNPSWFPKYKKLDENLQMPDYTKLNEE